MPISNASLLDLAGTAAELADGWTDADTGEAVSTSEVNAPAADPKATVWSFDSKTSAVTNDHAERNKDVGSIDGLGNRIVISVKVYCDAIGTLANQDYFILAIFRSDWGFDVVFVSDGLYIYDGAVWNEIGTDIVVQDTWQEWTFDVDISGGVAAAVCDVYLNNVLQASDIDCSYTGTWTDGTIILRQSGYGTDDLLSYIDWLKVGDGFGWTGKINGVTNPAKINGIAVANIAKVLGI